MKVAILGYKSSDGTFKPVRLDSSTESLQTVDYSHHEIHSGSHFFYFDYDGDVDTASPMYN